MKFSIRDLLLVTVIVALAVGWSVDHYRPGNPHHQRDLKADAMWQALKSEGFEVEQEGWTVRIYRKSNAAKNDYELHEVLPNSSAPAPNPPKP